MPATLCSDKSRGGRPHSKAHTQCAWPAQGRCCGAGLRGSVRLFCWFPCPCNHGRCTRVLPCLNTRSDHTAGTTCPPATFESDIHLPSTCAVWWPPTQEITAAQVEDALNSLVKDAPNSPVNMPGSIIQQCRVVVELPRPQRTDLRPPPPSTHHGHPVAGPLPLSTQNLLMLDQQANVMGLAAVAFVTVNESWQLDLVMGPSTPSLGSTTHPGPLHNGAHPPVSQATAVAAGRHAPHANGASGRVPSAPSPC
jgi:hypothetical protein